MKSTKDTRTELSADQLRETLIAREERRRRKEAANSWRFVPDYPATFFEDELRTLRAAPDPLAIPVYGMIFERGDEARYVEQLLWGEYYQSRYNPYMFRDWRDRHARIEAALAYLLEAGLVVPSTFAGLRPFKLVARWWFDRWFSIAVRQERRTPEQIEKRKEYHLGVHIEQLTDPHYWRPYEYEPTKIRRVFESARPMYWRLVRRLPAYAHLPEAHPLGETNAERERRYRQERARAC